MWRKFINYITFKKSETDGNFNLKVMHRINRLSIWMFLIAVIIMAVRYFF